MYISSGSLVYIWLYLTCLSLFPYSMFQGWPHICRQLPDRYPTWHRVCGIQHRRVVCCQCVNHGQWSQSAGRSCGCRQVPSCSSSPVFLVFETRLPDRLKHICFSSSQALAGFRLFDHLRNRTTRHAEAACGGLVVSAQLPSWHCLLLWRPGPRPAQTQGQLPQDPDRGQTGRKGGLRGGLYVVLEVLSSMYV